LSGHQAKRGERRARKQTLFSPRETFRGDSKKAPKNLELSLLIAPLCVITGKSKTLNPGEIFYFSTFFLSA
jgi:hypothetical protein